MPHPSFMANYTLVLDTSNQVSKLTMDQVVGFLHCLEFFVVGEQRLFAFCCEEHIADRLVLCVCTSCVSLGASLVMF